MQAAQMLVLIVLLPCLLVTGTSVAGPAPQQGGRLTIGTGIDLISLDMHNYRTTSDVMIGRLIFDTLVVLDNQLRLRPSLATNWLNLGPTAWRFTLRKNVSFSDGTPLTAEAVKISLERAAKTPSGAAFVGEISNVEVIDPSTVVVHTKRPFAPLLSHLTSPIAAIKSPSALERYRTAVERNPVGSGPFLLKEWLPNQRTVLARNPQYWGRAPYLDEVVFRPIPEESTRYLAFRGREIDVISDPPPNLVGQIRRDPRVQLLTSPATRDLRLGFNVKHPSVQDARVRRAVALAIDREAIVRYVVEGLAMEAKCSIVPPIIMETKPCVTIDHDVAKARQLLAEAGRGQGFETELWTPEGRYLRDKQIAEAIQQQLTRVGIRVNIRVLEWAAFRTAVIRGEAPMFILGWGFITGDPASGLRQTFWSRTAFKYHHYESTEVDQLLDAAEAELNPTKRREMYSQIQQILLERDVVAKEIYHKMNIFAAWDHVRNFVPHPLELIDVAETWVGR